MKYLITVALLFLAVEWTHAQSLDDAFEREVRFRKHGMMVLGSWAAVNIAGGMALRSNAIGDTRYFHEMNALWNTVNLGIAAFGYFGAMRMAAPADAFGLYQEQVGMDKALLFNAGLDLAYIAAGFWAMERSKNVQKNQAQWKGYGQSIALQGAFLFAFDVAMVLLHKKVEVPANLQMGLRPGAPDFLSLSMIF